MYEDVTEAFVNLSHAPHQDVIIDTMPQLERFVVLMYDRGSSCITVNTSRQLFTQKGRAMDALPPTEAALLQHVKRVAYQAGHVWGQALLKNPVLPSPLEWGWIKTNTATWEPFWTALPEASKSCQELIKCDCDQARGCRSSCKCVKSSMKCTALCKCGGDCDRP